MDEEKIKELQRKPRAELIEYEIAQLEEHDFNVGPLSILQTAVRNRQQVLISLRNDQKLLARVKAFDRHCNMILESAKLMWETRTKNAEGKIKSKPDERFIAKLFLRGDTVVMVVLVGQ